MKTTKTQGGEIQTVTMGAIVCKRYIGVFRDRLLQECSITGLWYATIQGNDSIEEGSGVTPEEAVKDTIKRNEETIRQMWEGVALLKSSLLRKAS